MRKLTKANLDELATMMPVLSEHEQRIYVGGNILINRNTVRAWLWRTFPSHS